MNTICHSNFVGKFTECEQVKKTKQRHYGYLSTAYLILAPSIVIGAMPYFAFGGFKGISFILSLLLPVGMMAANLRESFRVRVWSCRAIVYGSIAAWAVALFVCCRFFWRAFYG